MTKEEKAKYYQIQFEKSKEILENEYNISISSSELSELLTIHFDFDSNITH